MGRWFERDDEPSAVLSYRTWQRLFHADPHILGKRIRSETRWYTVIGIAPPEYAGIYLPLNTDLWIPFQAWASQYPDLTRQLDDRFHPRVFVFGRLKSGVDPHRATAEANALLPVDPRHPAAPIVAEHVRGVPNANSRRQSVPISILLLAVVAVILLIACVNVGNLLLARGAARTHEISLRAALGARRSRLMRQLLTESVLLSIAGGALGIVFGAWTSRMLAALLPSTAFGESLRLDLAPDGRVIAATVALALFTTLLFGVAPAWRSSRAGLQPGLALRGLHPHSVLRRISLVAQVSLSMLLLLTAGLFLRVLFAFQTADPGFAVRHRLYVTTLASAPEFTPAGARRFYQVALARLRALPGVRSAATTSLLPLTPVNPNCASTSGREPIPATSSTVSPGYLAALQIPLDAGRDFSPADGPATPPVAIVNQTLARRIWPGQSAVGKHLAFGCRNPFELEVVGVARDARTVSLGELPKPHLYLAFAQNSEGVQNIVVETASRAACPEDAVRRAISGAGARVYGIHPLSEWVDRSYWQVRWEASMLAVFGLLALALAAVGLYGVVAYHVTLRTREMGIRLAIGAQPKAVLRMVLAQGLRLTAYGACIGLAASAVLARGMSRLLFGVNPADPLTYLTVTLLWLTIGAVAAYLPARRAASVDPAVALREE